MPSMCVLPMQVEFCFSLYDADLDGRVSRAELEEMMSAALDLEAEQRSRQTRSRSRTCVDQLLFASLKTGSPTPSPSAAEASEQPRDEKDREDDHPGSEGEEGGEENDNPRAEGVHPALDQRSKQAQLQNILEIAFRPAALPESAEPKTHLTLHEFRRFTEDQPISMQILAQVRICWLCVCVSVSVCFLLVLMHVTSPFYLFASDSARGGDHAESASK